jgi:hypothetical protein
MEKNTNNLPYSYDFLARQAYEAEQSQQFNQIIKDEQEIIHQIRMHDIAIAGLMRQLGEKQTLIRDHVFAKRASVAIESDRGSE